MAQRGVFFLTVSTASQQPPPSTITTTHTQKHTPSLLYFPRQKKKRQLIYLQLFRRGWRGWGGIFCQAGLGRQRCTYVCAHAVYREWRQGYHSARQNALGSPSGRSRYHCSTTAHSSTVQLSNAPLQNNKVQQGRATNPDSTGRQSCFSALKNRPKLHFYSCSILALFEVIMVG